MNQPHARLRLSRLPGSAFDAVFKEGKRVGHPMATLIYRRHSPVAAPAPMRVGIAVPRAVARGAVSRNRLRRLLRESFRLRAHEVLEHSVDCVILARPGIKGVVRRQQIDIAVENLLRRAKF